MAQTAVQASGDADKPATARRPTQPRVVVRNNSQRTVDVRAKLSDSRYYQDGQLPLPSEKVLPQYQTRRKTDRGEDIDVVPSDGTSRASSLIEYFDHAQPSISEKTEIALKKIAIKTAQSESPDLRSVSGLDVQYGELLLRKNAEAPLSSPTTDLPVVDSLPPLESPAAYDEANAITQCGDGFDGDEDDGISDIISVPSLYSGSAGSIEESEVAAEELASLLLKDDSMKFLYDKALEKVGTDRFERNFLMLLNVFAVHLRVEANTVLELSGVHFVRTRAKWVASCMGKQLDPRRVEAVERMHKLILESSEREEKVETYLQRRILTTDLAENLGPCEIDHQDIQEPTLESGHEGSETEAAEQPWLRDLEEVKTFILTSSAMATLRENFCQFVSQGQWIIQKLAPSAASHQGPPPESFKCNAMSSIETDSDSLNSLKNDEGDLGGQEEDRISRSIPAFVVSILRGCRMIAEFLELKEKPLRQGFRRLRWTCVSFIFLDISFSSKYWCTKYQHVLEIRNNDFTMA